jgi:hypothetical protein
MTALGGRIRNTGTRTTPDHHFTPRHPPCFLRCHCEEGRSPDAAIQRTRRHPTATPRQTALRPGLDCHVSSLRDLPRNDSTGGTHPKYWDANHARPPRHTLASAMFLRCHCEEGVSLTRQSSDRVGNPPQRPGIPCYDPDWIATSVLFETFLAMTALGDASEILVH